MKDQTLQIMDMPVNHRSLMPVVWSVISVESSASGSVLHLRGKVIRALIREADAQEYISATIPASAVVGGVYFIQPGVHLVSCPWGSDWVQSLNLPAMQQQHQFSPPSQEPRQTLLQSIRIRRPDEPPDPFFSWSEVSDIGRHRAFFLLTTDHYTGKVEGEILKAQKGRQGMLQILVGRATSTAQRHHLLSMSRISPPQKPVSRRYHPYVDEFETPVMTEWVSSIPPIMPVPELMEDESYTLIGYVVLKVPPQSITIQREHEVETQPVLRSPTIHKSPRANVSHTWTMSFVVVGDDINTRLVPLLRMIDRCPFLPIVNLMFLEAGIAEVVVETVEVSTIPDHPNALQVQLSGRNFDTGGLGFALPYGLNFNWPLFKMYNDYLPRFLPVDIPMNGRVQLLVPSDEYISSLIDRFFETNNMAMKLGFSPGGGASPETEVPSEVFTEPGKGHFALLPLPSDPSTVGRYEVVRVDNPTHFKHIASAVLAGSVDGLEARTLTVTPDGKTVISQGVIPNLELQRLMKNVDSGKSGPARSAMQSVVFCWRMDSQARVNPKDLDTTLSRVLNASFSRGGSTVRSSRSVGPVSDGAPRAFDRPEMVPFLPEGLNVVWHSVSAGFSNIVSALRRDVGDPVMQYLGKSDITVVLQGMADAESVAVLRSLFDRYIAIVYMLRGLSFIHPVRINFLLDNEIARLVGLEEVIPLTLEVQNVEGHPDQYQVTLTFVGMDPGGVQRRAMRRLSDNVERDQRMFALTYSGLDAAKQRDRLAAALRRSELYPDLRLPSYGLIIEWCRALAYENHHLRDYAVSCLRGLAPGLDQQGFRKYLQEVQKAMRTFLDNISRSGLLSRMASVPYVFADPDFYFHDGNGVGAQIRKSIRRAIAGGGEANVVFTDDSGVSASIHSSEGRWDVGVHQSQQELAESVRRATESSNSRHPYLQNHSSELSHIEDMVVSGFVDRVVQAGGASDDPVASVTKDQSAAYKELSDRFRDAYAIKTSDLTMRYSHDVRSDDVANQVSQLENGAINGYYMAAQVLRGIFEGKSELDATPAEATGSVKDGVVKIIDLAVDMLVQQAGNPPLDKSFKLTNAATDPRIPGTFSVVWKPVRWGFAVRTIKLVSPILKPFILGMIEQESSFDPNASSGEADGIGQFTNDTWYGLLRSGRYAIYLLHSGAGNSPVTSPFRWDVATIMSLYYLLELVSDAVYNVVGKDEKLRQDFVDYIYMDSPGKKSRAKSDPTVVLNEAPGSAVAERLLVLGACLYNAGPQSLRSVLSQLAANVRAGRRGADVFAIRRTDSAHGRHVYTKYARWKSSLPGGGVPVQQRAIPKGVQVQGAVSPFISQDTNRLFDIQRRYSPSRVGVNAAALPGNAGDPFGDLHTLRNFPLLPMTGWADTCRYQPHGRLLQCFPTYCLLLVQGGRWVRWHRFWDHFYGLFSVMSIDVHKSRESPQHTAEIILSNSYRQLSNLTVTQAYAQAAIAGMRPFQQVQGEELMRGYVGSDTSDFINQLVKSVQNSLFPILGDYERHVWNQEMKALFLHPGERIHLRIGYGADAAALPIVFNGTIASVDIQGSVIRVLALGDGRELMREIATEGQPYKNSNLFGQTVEVRNILIDMLASRRADSIPVIGPLVYTFSGAGLLNDSRFGIESFGRVEALAGSTALQDVASGNTSVRTFKILGMSSMQAAEGELGVNIYNSQRDSSNISIGMLPLLDTLTLGLSQVARNGDYIAIELKEGTVWDVFRNCQLAVLDALMSVEPFGLRSTLFFGRGHQALHYDYYDAGQLEALGVPDIASHIAMGGYWRIMRFKQYRQYHIAVSEWNLIANELIATSERMWNEVQSFDAEGVPGNKFTFDPAIVPEERKPITFHSALSTTLMSQLSLGAESNWVSVLARLGIVRSLIGERLGIAMPIRAVNNVSANLVREGISLMYDGSIVLAGAAEIKPNDFLFIDDSLRAMEGVVAVREVEHHFSTQHGYTTLVVPDACVLGNGDIDTINLAQASATFRNIALFYRLRREMIFLYRCYAMLLLNGTAMALSRLRFLQRVPGVGFAMNRFVGLMSLGARRVRPDWREVYDVVSNALRAGGSLSRDFFGTLFRGAWTVKSLKDTLFGVVKDGFSLLRAVVGRNSGAIVASMLNAVSRLASLGAARPLLAFRSVASATARALAGRVALITLVANTALEMINRKLSSYYPCRLYPVRVNGLPLTAGIRGHFGTVEGDDPAPMQRVLDVVTLQGVDVEKWPPLVRQLGEWVKALWPLQRTVPTGTGVDEELEDARQQFERRSRYDIMGVFGSVSENYGVTTPTLREGSDEVVRRNRPYTRSTVGYAKGDDPAKGDYLFDLMDPQASAILRDLVSELRRRGVMIAIHQGRRSMEEQTRLYRQLQSGARSKAVAKPTPNAPHVAGHAIDVQYRYPDGTFRSTPPPGAERIILQVVREFNVRYANRVRWLGDRSKYSGSVYEPWHFDVKPAGG